MATRCGSALWLTLCPTLRAAAPNPSSCACKASTPPERCQAWGAQATAALEVRVLHQRVQVQTRAKDDHQRALGNLLLNGEDVNAWMVTQGHAWSYRFRRSGGPYAEPEQQARAARRGLFADPAATEPRWFRRDHGPCL